MSIFLFSSCENSTEPDVYSPVPLDEKAIPLIKINNYFCFPDNSSLLIMYPIDGNNVELNGIVEYSESYYDNIFINDSLIVNNESYDFGTVSVDSEFTLKTVIENEETEYQINFTTLPTIMFYANEDIVDEPKISSRIIVNDIISNNTFDLYSGIEIRGGSSQNYPKVSYDIELWEDKDGVDTEKERLFDMRNDDDWIFDAMYLDLSKSRNVMSFEIWESFANAIYLSEEEDARLALSGQLVEIFINNEYLGIYSCNEQIDKKQLKIDDDEGRLYKAEVWTSATRFEAIDETEIFSDTWGGYELKHPDENISELTWQPLIDLIALIAYSDDSTFVNSIEQMIDIDNIIRYYIFINLIQAPDNAGKNMFISKYKEGYPLSFVPWDLDITYDNDNTPWFPYLTIEDIITNNLFDRLYSLDVNNYRDQVKMTWQEINQPGLSDQISSKFTENINQLIESNATIRENNKWNFDTDYNDELNHINTWIINRISIFDSYINSNY